jgi:hypothetical protein
MAGVRDEQCAFLSMEQEVGVAARDFKDQPSRDATTWTAADGVRAAGGMQGSYDNLEDYLATLARG